MVMLTRMASGYTPPSASMNPTAHLPARPEGSMTSLPAAILVDVDGTVALRGDRSPYDETSVHLDTPHLPVITVVRAMHAAGHAVIFCSGRTTNCRDATEQWLARRP